MGGPGGLNNWQDRLWRDALPHVQAPGQYVGAEWNMVRKDPARVALRFCLAFPDTYAIGMSHGGLHVLYGILNRREDVYAERAFAPWVDMQARLRLREIPLCSLETCTPLSEFDVVGFSLQYEMGFTNLLDMLELGGIPLLCAERSPDDPIVVAGGPCAFNPEPLADYVDLFVLGEGEERIEDLADACIALKRERPRTREEAVCFLAARVPNSYAPSLYEIEQGADGRLKAIRPRDGLPEQLPERIESGFVRDLDSAYVPTQPIVPFVEVVHDRISIEIMRGCSRGCRFCRAGMTRRPVRCRSVEKIVSLCEAQYAATGYSEISLASLSSSDYPDLRRLVREISMRFAERKVSVNLPSLRVTEQLGELPGLISTVRKSTLTLAPEAATERLRRVINKEISDDNLYRGVEAAFCRGWSHVKLYFMTGLPTETDEDIAGIAQTAEKVSRLRRKLGKGAARVNLSVATFVPKPHTPFQWEPMVALERMADIRALLRRSIRRKTVALKFHRPERSFLEGVFARGDRRLGRVLLEAHRLGCRFDAWDETFAFEKWRRAFDKAGIVGENYVDRVRDREEVLPWSHLSAGVSDEFLWRERTRAMEGEYTSDCGQAECHDCGLENCPRRRQTITSAVRE